MNRMAEKTDKDSPTSAGGKQTGNASRKLTVLRTMQKTIDTKSREVEGLRQHLKAAKAEEHDLVVQLGDAIRGEPLFEAEAEPPGGEKEA
jgi:hypothetical protein